MATELPMKQTEIIPCECSGPGFCQRYKIHQTDYAWKVCSGKCDDKFPCSPSKTLAYQKRWASDLRRKQLVELSKINTMSTVQQATEQLQQQTDRQGKEVIRPVPRRRGPGIIQKMGNAVRAVGRATTAWVKGEAVFAPKEVAEQRKAICVSNQCGFYDSQNDTCTNRKCGCSVGRRLAMGTVSLPGKTEIATEKCPVGLWGTYEQPSTTTTEQQQSDGSQGT